MLNCQAVTRRDRIAGTTKVGWSARNNLCPEKLTFGEIEDTKLGMAGEVEFEQVQLVQQGNGQ